MEQLKTDLAKAQEAGDAEGMRAKCEEEHKAFEFDPGPKTDRHSTNPLFIYGKSGLGKTHLLRAIQNYIAVNDPSRTCVYRVATDFIDDYSKAMKNARAGAAEALAENYHNIDVLIIDDIQGMSMAGGSLIPARKPTAIQQEHLTCEIIALYVEGRDENGPLFNCRRDARECSWHCVA